MPAYGGGGAPLNYTKIKLIIINENNINILSMNHYNI